MAMVRPIFATEVCAMAPQSAQTEAAIQALCTADFLRVCAWRVWRNKLKLVLFQILVLDLGGTEELVPIDEVLCSVEGTRVRTEDARVHAGCGERANGCVCFHPVAEVIL
jgi:hypothetical protein